MTVAELMACRVLGDPAFPTPTEAYVVSFVAFYEQEFHRPSHRFLRSMLQYYGLELHMLTPSGVLHIAAFITLCEAYPRVDPELDLWHYFFRVRCPQDPDAELTVSRCAVIHVNSGHGVGPYFDIPMPRSMKGWPKNWFYLRNNASAPLLMFTGSHPIPMPSSRHGVARKDLGKLHPVCEALQQVHLLQTLLAAGSNHSDNEKPRCCCT
jgi:hypothetical protein